MARRAGSVRRSEFGVAFAARSLEQLGQRVDQLLEQLRAALGRGGARRPDDAAAGDRPASRTGQHASDGAVRLVDRPLEREL